MDTSSSPKGRILACLAVVAAVTAVAGVLYACSPNVEQGSYGTTSGSSSADVAAGSGAAAEPAFAAPTTVPDADEFGVITSASWAAEYPLQYESYLMNAYNVPPEYKEITATEPDVTSVGVEQYGGDLTSVKADYLSEDQYPEIKTLGKGYGYAKYYTEPAGHTYSLWSIEHNGRLGDVRGGNTKGKYSCYACKTPQIHFEALAEDDGSGTFWTQSATVGVDHLTENISCANCHQNDNPTVLNVLRADWIRAMGDDMDQYLEGAVCGQCHCDYSMAPTGDDAKAPFNDGEPTSPYYGGVDSMTPEQALAFYDEYNFADWTYASTGAKMLAVRHAEFEFNYGNGQNPMVKMGYDCTDCHMGVTTSEDGTAYTNHCWMSPLDNEELLAECNQCHNGDLTSEIKALQADIDGRTHELGLRAEQFIFDFEDKVAKEVADEESGEMVLTFDMDTAKANGLTEDQVAELQQIQRYACYYWNLAAAENSEGAHNPTFYNELLDKGNELLDQADEILGVSSQVA